jgi:hypothetical protein
MSTSPEIYWDRNDLSDLAKMHYMNRLLSIQTIALDVDLESGDTKTAHTRLKNIETVRDGYKKIQLEIPRRFTRKRLSIYVVCPIYTKLREPKVMPYGNRSEILLHLEELAIKYRKASIINQLQYWPINFKNIEAYNAWKATTQAKFNITNINPTLKASIDRLLESTTNAERVRTS